MIKHLLIIMMVSLSFHSYANEEEGEIQWMTIKEALAKNEYQSKKIFVDIYTDWCGYCKKMNKTYSNKVIADYINKNYHPVKLNAETYREVVRYKGENYEYNVEAEIHELAYALMDGNVSYPSTAYLDENSEYLIAMSGYKEPEEMELMLHYMKESVYEEEILPEDYKKTTFRSQMNVGEEEEEIQTHYSIDDELDPEVLIEELLEKWVMYFGLYRLKAYANSGDVVAQRRLGRYYRYVVENHDEAAKWFRKASDQKDYMATYLLGLVYYLGEGVEENEYRAIALFEEALLYEPHDETDATDALEEVKGGDWTTDKKLEIFKREVEQKGNKEPVMEYQLGMAYYDAGEKEKGMNIFKKLAKKGFIPAVLAIYVLELE